MHYIIIRKADAATERGERPSNDVLSAMADYNNHLLKAGVFVSGQGLRPSSEGCRLHIQPEDVVLSDGPFTESKELIAGFTVIKANSLEEARAWASQWPKEDAGAQLEVRRFFELSDFEPGSGLAKHQKMAAQMERLPVSMASYLNFPGTCRQAMQHYAELLGGEIELLLPFKDSPMAGDVPADWQDNIMHARLNIGGRILMGSDATPGQYQAPQGISVQLEFDTVAKAQALFQALAQSGQVLMPFGPTFWAKGFGMLTDRFGIGWIINCEQGD